MELKQPEVKENPPLSSPSDEESETSGEEEDDSSDEDQAPEPTQTNVAPAATNNVRKADSGPEPEPEAAKKKSESSTRKRSVKQSDDASKKKMKTSEEEDKKEVQLFERLFSETDDINLLQGMLHFTSARVWELDGFCDYIKDSINFNANRNQIANKIKNMRKKFCKTVKNALEKGKTQEQIVFTRPCDAKVYDFSRKLWGVNGVFQPRKPTEKPVTTSVSSAHTSSEIASFFMQENTSAVSFDETVIDARWDMVPDGPKKRELEEQLKRLKNMRASLCLKRTAIVADSAKLIFKDSASSSYGI